jgi:hypothetical protein
MKLTIEPTGTIEKIDGVPCRLWEGVTDQGVPVKAWVRTVQPQTHDPEALAAFESELEPTRVTRTTGVTGVMRTYSTEPPANFEDEHARVLGEVRVRLGNNHPMITGSVLAYLTALWAMAHQIDDDERTQLLDQQEAAVREMLPIAGLEIESIKRTVLQ